MVSSNICGALTLGSFLTFMLMYPVKELKTNKQNTTQRTNKQTKNIKLGTSLYIDKFTSEIVHHVYTVDKGIYAIM